MNLLFFIPVALILGAIAGYSIRYWIEYNNKKNEQLNSEYL